MSSRPALRTLTALAPAAAPLAVPAGRGIAGRGTAAPAGGPVTTPPSDRAQPGDESPAGDAARNELSRERFSFAMTERGTPRCLRPVATPSVSTGGCRRPTARRD
ncbi:hypothetical protein ACFWYW_52940 [Nonomuraea sp. NPDC059023]|uniref:hypothetical protein n=1 Tax=unclassified Nonomuraea TaxID=2593643 RepID=UPI0036BABEEB